MATSTNELRSQWGNPGDILSLLLLIGGDIMQKAVAQLVGHRIRLYGCRNRDISIALVAFSFGWAAYGFSNLLSAVGDMNLMPASDCPSLLVLGLGRLLRDHEIRCDVDPRPLDEGGRAESIRIDVFNLLPVSRPASDFVWWLGWVTLLVQVGIAVIPWVLYDDWGIMLVTLCGKFLVATTCALPQWTEEKLAGPQLKRDKVTCLTRTFILRSETRWMSLLLAVLWTCLLISVSSLKEHSWFLVGIGGIGMLQNIFAAGTPRKPEASNLHLARFSRAPTIIGRREHYEDDTDCKINLEDDLEQLADVALWAPEELPAPSQSNNSTPTKASPIPRWLASMDSSDGVPKWLEPVKPVQLTRSTPPASPFLSRICRWSTAHNKEPNEMIYAVGVHGALIELEKWVPTAGLAMIQIFFPGRLKYNDEGQRAHHTKSVRKRAEEKKEG
ncbi:hypothetical protein F5Y06DRAFT_287346 [Hypoxylon sp. FL0890]|nr:hypothetical protein F5Y06DRAFT_287346 [Hypoxylon sp. FL0890]